MLSIDSFASDGRNYIFPVKVCCNWFWIWNLHYEIVEIHQVFRISNRMLVDVGSSHWDSTMV